MNGQRASDSDFAEFSASALPSLRRMAFAWTGDWHSADDAVQTSLEKLYRAWGRLRPDSDPYPYVRKILIRVLMTESRSGWKRFERSTDRIPDRVGAVEPEVPGGDLAAAIAKLPPRQRAIVVLRYLEDLSVGEVAVALNCSPGTVKSQAFSARVSLKETLLELQVKADADD